jgi:hypothetical protein
MPVKPAVKKLTTLYVSAVVVQALCAPISFAQSQSSVDTAAWIHDLHQLQHEMAAHYANLDGAVTERDLDIPRHVFAIESPFH